MMNMMKPKEGVLGIDTTTSTVRLWLALANVTTEVEKTST